MSVFVLPTPERRRALAGALWCTARWIRTAYPPGESRLLYIPYLYRVQVLRAPGEFDFDAYDRAAGRRGAFLTDWKAHEAQALRLYRHSLPEAGCGPTSSPFREVRGRLRVMKGGGS